MENAVSIVTIKNKIPLYKKEEAANAIELIELEEVGFELVAQKGLYEIGDKAVYIQPDYNLSDIPLFESFLRPNGDANKSMLGKVNGTALRIRAKKFTLSKEPNGEYVYSNGILLPIKFVQEYSNQETGNFDLEGVNLTKLLNITKYEEPEYTSKNGMKVAGAMAFPQGLYKTDENNINNVWKAVQYPILLIGTEKVDGSSITIGVTQEIPEGFICSRNMRKSLTIKKHTGRRNKTLLEKIMFWKKPDLNLYTKVDSDDDFVKYGKPFLDKMLETKLTDVVLRGELSGGTLKGSGNKNNPASKEPVSIKFFGSDGINEQRTSQKNGYERFKTNLKILGFENNVVKQVFMRNFNSREELEKVCNEYFKENMIEGIVVRTMDSKFSAKIMNLEYDSKK